MATCTYSGNVNWNPGPAYQGSMEPFHIKWRERETERDRETEREIHLCINYVHVTIIMHGESGIRTWENRLELLLIFILRNNTSA